MNTKTLLCAVICICYASTICRAQEGNGAVSGDDAPVYIFDGEHTSFAYGRVIAANKIAVGLTDEGVYELRGDTAVWLVNHPGRQDELLCVITDDFTTGNKLFVLTMPDEQRTPIDTVCAYNAGSYTVFDKEGNIAGAIRSDGAIVSPQGKTLLLNMQSVDKLLAAFFFAGHYTPVRKQLKFSYLHNPAQTFYSYVILKK